MGANAWYRTAVVWAANSGVAKGVTVTRFDPNAPVTREQMVTFLYRYSQLSGKNVSAKASLGDFADSDRISGYAVEAMTWAVANGIIQGDGVRILPRNSAIRVEVAAVIMRYLEK